MTQAPQTSPGDQEGKIGSPYTREVLAQVTGCGGPRSRLYLKLGFSGELGRLVSISQMTRSEWSSNSASWTEKKCQSPNQNPGLLAPTPNPWLLSRSPCLVVEPRVTSSPRAGGARGVRTPAEAGDSMWAQGAPSSSLSSHCYPRSAQKSPKTCGWSITNPFSLWAKQGIKAGPWGGSRSAPHLCGPLVTSLPPLSGGALKTCTTHSGFPWGKMITASRVADNRNINSHLDLAGSQKKSPSPAFLFL